MCCKYTYCKVQVAPNLNKSVSCIFRIRTWPTGGCYSPANSTSLPSHCLSLVMRQTAAWLYRELKSEQGEILLLATYRQSMPHLHCQETSMHAYYVCTIQCRRTVHTAVYALNLTAGIEHNCQEKWGLGTRCSNVCGFSF